MGELKINQTPGAISYNFESTKAMLKDKLKEYKGAVFTEDSKVYAKKTIAELRGEKKELEKRVREAKKEWMIPFDNFEKDAKELIGLYDEPISFIDNQVKGFEEKRIADKQKLINDIYNEIVTEKEFLPLSKVYNKKWENSTYTKKKIKEELLAFNTKVHSEVETIKAFDSVDVNEALQVYKTALNVTDAITFINERAKVRADTLKREKEQQQREAEEMARKEERDRIKAEQEKEQAEQQKAEELQIAAEEAQQEVIENLTPDTSGEVMFYDYTIMLTKDAKEKLEMYMDSVGIEYIVK